MMTTPLKPSRLGRLLPTSLGILILLLSVQAQAGSTYLDRLNKLYRTAGTPLDNCGLCHNRFVEPTAAMDPGGLNFYGAAFKGSFVVIDGLRSDGDASSNGAEIRRGFFPGWDCSNYTKASGSLPANFMNLLDPDNIGCTANMPPLASLNKAYNGTENVRVDFDASGSHDPDGTVVQYDWDFGDGVTAMNSGPLASHTYTTPGNYVVTMTVTDDAGANATATAMAYIVAVPVHPIADPGGPYDAIEGVALTFDGSRSFDPDGGPIMGYYWDLGDGTMAMGAAPNHVYQTGGNFTVTLVVTDDEGLASDPATTPVSISGRRVNLPPIPYLMGPYNGTENVRLDFDANGSRDPDGTVVQYDWDFGDGVTAMNTGPLTSHAYTTPGNYVVTLTVTDDAGANATATAMAYIVAAPVSPIADPGGPYDAIEGVALTLDGSRSFDPDGGPIMSYSWDLGDGTMATGAAPNHVYQTSGNFTVTLVVSDDEGLASDPATTTVSIAGRRLNLPPIPDPMGPYTATTGQLVSFDGSGSSDPDGTIVAYDWDFGDGSTATGISPSYAYQAAGSYTVTLTVTDDSGLMHSAATTAEVADVLKQPEPACDSIRVKAVWKTGEETHKYWHGKRYRMRHHYRYDHDDDDEDDEDDEYEDAEDEDEDHKYGKSRYKHGKLIVFGRGQRGGNFVLSNADNPNQTMDSTRGRWGRFVFSIEGERLTAVPCRVQVEQPYMQLCGQVDVINAPADCSVPAPGVLPVLPDDDDHEWDDD